MSRQQTLMDMLDNTTSQGQEDGQSHSDSLESQTMQEFARAVRLANRSRLREKRRARKMRGISGQKCSGSSVSHDLQQFLWNKCRTQFPLDGSMEFRLTWNQKATPSGRWYCQLAASARQSSDTDYSLWPAPTATDAKRVPDIKQDANKANVTLNDAATFVPWAAPVTSNAKDTGDISASMVRKDGKIRNDTLTRQVLYVPWASPITQDNGGKLEDTIRRRQNSIAKGVSMGLLPTNLSLQVQEIDTTFAPWAAPTAQEYGGTPEQHLQRKEKAIANGAKMGLTVSDLRLQALTILGQNSPLSSAEIHGQTVRQNPDGLALNPSHSRWLMGYHFFHGQQSPNWKEWVLIQSLLHECGGTSPSFWQRLAEIVEQDLKATETQSCHKSQQDSSACVES